MDEVLSLLPFTQVKALYQVNSQSLFAELFEDGAIMAKWQTFCKQSEEEQDEVGTSQTHAHAHTDTYKCIHKHSMCFPDLVDISRALDIGEQVVDRHE